MSDEHEPDRTTTLTASSASSPQEVTEVLCREVGASHPDGALKQIRTMKRLLRSHYRVKQRLERYGIDSLSDAVVHIAELRRQVRRSRDEQREHALDRMEVLDDLMEAVDAMRRRLHSRPASASNRAPDTSGSNTSPDGSLANVDDLIEGLQQALDEIRLELWLHQSHDEEGPATPVASTAADLLDRLADEIDAATSAHERLRQENAQLKAQNESLQRDVDRLERTVEQKETRIEELEQQLERRAHHTNG
jgi:chromosome segregation ATPase